MLKIREQQEHLLLFFFGAGKNPIEQCVNRAYRDFNRTMHGIKDYRHAALDGHSYLYEGLRNLQTDSSVDDQNAFDAFHERSCHELIDSVTRGGYSQMYVGQAQKWLNMALKYIFLFPTEQLPGFERVFPWCHVPIDNIILRCREFKGAPKLSSPWSRIADYATYMSFQCWAKQAFPGQAPLAIEFKAWAEAKIAV